MRYSAADVSTYKWFQLVTVLVLATLFLLATAARRYPHVTWLRGFANAFPRLPEAQRRQAAKRADFYAGAELIVAGLALPMAYAALTMMTFSSYTTAATVVVAVGSVFCIALGIVAIVHSRR